MEISLPDALTMDIMSFSDSPRSLKIIFASSTTEAGIAGSGVDVEIFAVF